MKRQVVNISLEDLEGRIGGLKTVEDRKTTDLPAVRE